MKFNQGCDNITDLTMFRKRFGIQLKIVIALLAVGLISGLVSLIFTFMTETRGIEDSFGPVFQTIATETSRKIDMIIDKKAQDARSLAAMLGTNFNSLSGSDIERYIERYQKERGDEVISILVTNKKGVTMAATQGRIYSRKQSTRTFVERFFLYDIDIDGLNQTSSISMSAPITESLTGEIAGTLNILYDLREVFSVIYNLRIWKTGHTDLVSSDGTLLACSLSSFPGHNISNSMLHQLSSTKPGWMRTHSEEHGITSSITGYSPVSTEIDSGETVSEGRKLYVLVSQFYQDSYSPFYDLLRKTLLISPAAILLLSFFVYVTGKWIAKPIKDLSRGVELMGQGELNHDLNINTGDEIEQLADNFTQMAKNLGSKFDEIRLEKDKLNTVMDNIGDGLIILDQDCRIKHMNTKFIKELGRDSIGKSCREVFGFEDLPCNNCSVRKEEDFRPHTLEADTNKGRSYIITHSRIKNLDGTSSTIEVFTDITERKRLEQQLLNTERVAALSRFSSTFAHDLRNPIIAVKKTLEMLRDAPSLTGAPANSGIYTDLISTCELTLCLINDVLDVHQVSYSELPLIYSSFSLSDALSEVVSLLRIEAMEKKNIIEINGRDDISVEGDKRRIQRVFINLMSNAIRHSPPEGTIRIEFQSNQQHIPDDNSSLVFSIEDEGPGIPLSDLSNVFDLFYKKDIENIKSGTGLGLYFCKVVVNAHGGRIWAENKISGGAVFKIEMPLVRRSGNAN
ncbi:MAG: HAMP domain-containing protein [Nitrospirae bacterium]|nr:HAMP domain-containing protein [Nitrospirota bacterium]